jgi:hypothetical protein
MIYWSPQKRARVLQFLYEDNFGIFRREHWGTGILIDPNLGRNQRQYFAANEHHLYLGLNEGAD